MLTRRRRRRSRSASPPVQRASRQSQAAKQEIRDSGERDVGGIRGEARLSGRDDAAEVEARRVADRVVAGASGAATPAAPSGGPPPGRAAVATGTVHRSEKAGATPDAGASGNGPAGAARDSHVSTGPSEPLPAPERRYFEDRMGADLSHVGVRRDKAAAVEAEGYSARAFTEGSTVSFGEGEWRPGDREGRRLIAHELAHTLQQADGVIARDDKADAEAQAKYKKEKQAAFKADFPQKSWGVRKLEQKSAEAFVKALVKQAGVGTIFKGSPAKFAKDVVLPINARKGVLTPGQWMAFPIGWKDPNIGSMAAEVKALNKSEAQKTDIIATIYAEQSLSRETEIEAAQTERDAAKTDKSADGKKRLKAAELTLAEEKKTGAVLDEQRRYIYYAMLLRIESEQFPPTLKKIVTPEIFHGKQVGSGTFKRNYKPAKDLIEKGKSNRPVNEDALEKIQKFVGDASVKPPKKAGPFYFHWSASTKTAESEYQAVKAAEEKAGRKKTAADTAEKRGAYKQAKEVVKATMKDVTPQTGWLKKIAGQNRGKADERFGSMYIYR
ncbi:DUF4157 domain-containing protein [Methylopila sp. M107]|uniref:eCIS core domain-containing protein n=1 Tax=Methylopila sp. M107 TaxID=1101190 RepID=UPI00037836AC|nr:DUF4157 domain-containing protein [Methylopila sp. M107]